ncbi:fimbria/pilus outer membrane usher protein [Erwinia sp. CGal63]|uniref:fimbria/pilus outer membrane usher protein n=1 Tax=Erwinia sp. CGal63 TaxID=2919889 RepID=UPI0030093C84
MISFEGKQAAGGAACLMLFALLLSRQIYADEPDRATFNASFLKGMTGLNSDLSRFSKGNPVDPGNYSLDIYLNGERFGMEEIRVIQAADGVKTCFPGRLLNKLPLKEALSEEKQQAVADEQNCVSFAELFDTGKMQLNTAELRMDITLPQASLVRNARGFVAPEMWETGANALNFSYNANAYRSVTPNLQYDSAYARTLLGLNFYGWMFRHEGSFNWQNQSANDRYYEGIATYIQKDIPPLKSRLLLGEGNTTGELFDTLAFRGVQLSSVEQMWPDSLRGYAPQISGVADSTAQVTVSQNGTKLYETTVSPGAFVINDLYPTGYGGDLNVTIKEADGREKYFSVPYTSLAGLKRPGMSSYSLTAGVSRIDNLVYKPKIFQATVQHGISNAFTGYSGVQATDNATSLLLGAAVGLPIGAFSVDMTGARTEYGDKKERGLNFRTSWNKKVAATETDISLTFSRSSAGYFSYNDAIHINNYVKRGREDYEHTPVKERIALTFTQPLGTRYGSFYASAYRQSYWRKGGTNTQFQLGYGGHIERVLYNLSARRVFYALEAAETTFTVDFSIPLGGLSQSQHHYFSGSATHAREGTRAQSSIHGTLGSASQYSYNVGVSRDSTNNYAGNFSGSYRSPWTSMQMAYTQGDGYYSASGGLSGSMVLMADSLTLSAYQTTTLAVVSAEHAEGATISGYPDIVLDSGGHAIVPNLMPYKINELSLDPKGISADVELTQTSQRVVPVEGAIMKVSYKSVSGRPVLLRATLADGSPLPFGAEVKDEEGRSLATVMQGGQLYFRLDKDQARLLVVWGRSQKSSCSITLTASELEKSESSRLEQFSKQCVQERTANP